MIKAPDIDPFNANKKLNDGNYTLYKYIFFRCDFKIFLK